MTIIIPTIDTKSLLEQIDKSLCKNRTDYESIKRFLPKSAYKIVLDRLIKIHGRKCGLKMTTVGNIIGGVCNDNWGVWDVVHELAMEGLQNRVQAFENASKVEHLRIQVEVLQALADGKNVAIDGKSLNIKTLPAYFGITRISLQS